MMTDSETAPESLLRIVRCGYSVLLVYAQWPQVYFIMQGMPWNQLY